MKLAPNDLFETPLDQAEIDFENEGGETYICGNPPYVGDTVSDKGSEGRSASILSHERRSCSSTMSPAGSWKAADYIQTRRGASPSSPPIPSAKGVQVPLIWPRIIAAEQAIFFGPHGRSSGATTPQATMQVTVRYRRRGECGSQTEALHIRRGRWRRNERLKASTSIWRPARTSLSIGRMNRSQTVAIMYWRQHAKGSAEIFCSHPTRRGTLTASHPAAAAFIQPIYGFKRVH